MSDTSARGSKSKSKSSNKSTDDAASSSSSKPDGGSNNSQKISFLQFVILASLFSGIPYGNEYSVYAAGVGLSILWTLLLAVFLSFPVSLISTELTALMPTNHGALAWIYRSFHNISPAVGDFIGFLNVFNYLTLFVIMVPLITIIFEQYFATIIGVGVAPVPGAAAATGLSYGQAYGLKLAVIVVAFFVNALNINIIGNVVNYCMLLSMVPFFIGFFWQLPDIRWSQVSRGCTTYHLSFFVAQMAYTAGGYEYMGSLAGELSFDKRKIFTAYAISIFISVAFKLIPIITAATIPYESCASWFDGYFAVAYGSIFLPLYYAILSGALFSSFATYVIMIATGSRLVWAAAQPYLLLDTRDGSMILPAEMEIIPINERDQIPDGLQTLAGNAENELALHSDSDSNSDHNHNNVNIVDNSNAADVVVYKKIALGILPTQCGWIWKRTGSPFVGVLIFSVLPAITTLFVTYQTVVSMAFFMYAFTFYMLLIAFLLMRIHEPDTVRIFKIPGGMRVAGLMTIVSMSIMTLFFGVLVWKNWMDFLICLGWNLLGCLYYCIWKKWLPKYRRRRQKQREYEEIVG